MENIQRYIFFSIHFGLCTVGSLQISIIVIKPSISDTCDNENVSKSKALEKYTVWDMTARLSNGTQTRVYCNYVVLVNEFVLCDRFQAAIRKYGVGDEEIFQTADLFERRNVSISTQKRRLYIVRTSTNNDTIKKICTLFTY